MKALYSITRAPQKYRHFIREKAISRARTRIIVAGGEPKNFSAENLEVIVREEEDKIKSDIAQKGLLAVLALFGLSLI